MPGINTRQEDARNLEILRAFSVKYQHAKKSRSPRIIITYTLVVFAPFALFYFPNAKGLLAIIGATWALTAVVLAEREKVNIKEAAKIQEEFDTRVFDISWNKLLVGDRIPTETVINLSNRFKGEADKKWYGDVSNIPPPLDVILCQRSNLVWDWRLRKNYFIVSLIGLILLFLGGVCVSLGLEVNMSTYIASIFLPSSSAYILGYKETKEHFDNYTSKRTIEGRLNNIIDTWSNTRQPIDNALPRQAQDLIYNLRKCPAVVPDWFYQMSKEKYDRLMQAVINRYANLN